MNETRPNHRLIETEDQSPSLETTYQSGVIEKMHHFRGAFSETVYVYGPAIEWALNQVEQPRVMSLGLGLGYNEFLALGMAMAAQKSLSLTTFELDRQLVTQLISWTNNSQPEWAGAYDSIIERVATEVRVSHEALKDFVVESLKNGLWQIRRNF